MINMKINLRNSLLFQPKNFFILFMLLLLNSIIITGDAQPSIGDFDFIDRHNCIDFLFSGSNNSGMVACPWDVNESASQLLGRNEAFRTYFEADFKNTTQSFYPDFFNESLFTFNYEFAANFFTDPSKPQIRIPDEESYFSFPYAYNSSEFDPYFCSVSINVTDHDLWEQWNDTVCLELRDIFRPKWYVRDVMVPYGYPGGGSPATYPWVWSLVALVPFAAVVNLLKKKNNDD